MSFKEELRTKTEEIEKLLTAYLPEETGLPEDGSGSGELQCAGRWQASPSHADEGDLSDVRRPG